LIKILSLGAGVQSTTVLLMSCKGELPKLDAAIFSDTQWEPREVYEHLEWLKTESEKHGITVYTVTNGNLRDEALKVRVSEAGNKYSKPALPYQIKNPDGSLGKGLRHCTMDYKIVPVNRKIKEDFVKPRFGSLPSEPVVEIWFGISTDEKQRARVSTEKWADFHYPLLLDKPMARYQCDEWLKKNYPERYIPRSSCIGCPFHSNDEWRRVKARPEEWADAVDFDKRIRLMGCFAGQPYLHFSAVPLDEADLGENSSQGDWVNECMGMCGV